MDTAVIERAVQLAANDGEFRIAARYWTGVFRLFVDDHAHVLHVDDGAISRLDLNQPADVAFDDAVTLSGPADGWTELLAPIPRPFYQDIGGAQRHGFALWGDHERRFQYYPALQRFVVLLREAGEQP
jgi:hypothetical protein